MKLLSLIGFKIQSGPRVFLIAPKHLALIYIRKTTYFVFYWQNDTMLQRKIWQHIRNILTKEHLFVRWGNDRFILFTATSSKEQTYQFLKRLKQDCETLFSISLYIGIGQTVTSNNMNICYEQALRALSVSLETKKLYLMKIYV